jgi:late competence protein required for DNA uptake (superfamily II DNA/RNA helicase)
VSVATVRLEEEAKNLYKLPIVVVATSPLIVVVITELFSSKETLFELIIDEVDTSPFTIEVNSFTTEFS